MPSAKSLDQSVAQSPAHGDSNGNGLIEVTELVAHVQAMVPKLAASGEARAAVPRGAAAGAQSAHFGTTGGEFALVRRVP
jgi:hypothetical protein